MYLTPHRTSAMAMFGFVYLWYLLVVLLMEIWLDFRKEIVLKSQIEQGRGEMGLQGFDARLAEYKRGIASDRRTRWLDDHGIGHPFGFFAARVCRIHFRIGKGEPMVVESSDAGGVFIFGDGLRYCRGPVDLYGGVQAAA